MGTKVLIALKNVLLWSYERGTWQYDVLCLLILAFIFLTPSSWFNRSNAGSIPQRGMEQREAASRPPLHTNAPSSERKTERAHISPAPAIDK
ncbi:hypothetical protein HRbin10_00789 [bacterium HR10]|nr:hypothetical protein HRbin10_00789 [bacterium HR10]